MARFLLSGLLFGLLQVCVSNPLAVKRWDDLELRHSWSEIPRGWELIGPAPAEHNLEMRIGLKQDRIDELISTLYQVSDPVHEKYGAHLSKQEVDALVAPHPETIAIVESWLTYHGIDPSRSVSRTSAGNWISMTVPVGRVEEMLGNTYNVYRHATTFEVVVRTMNYSLPSVLRQHIDVVTPTTYFGTIKSMRSTSFVQSEISSLAAADDISVVSPGSNAVSSSCARTITPSCLIALYNTTGYVPKSIVKNMLGIPGYLNQYASHADLQTFFQRYLPGAVGTDFLVTTINGGGNDQTNPGIEANLDTQYGIGLSYPTPSIYYSTGGSPPYILDANTPTNSNEPYLDWVNYVLAQTTIPQTFTTSYGDDEQTVPLDYAISVCNLFAQLGTRGASVLFSSGDSGVGGGSCTTFIPNFPASCPFVTTVGGTTGINPETGIYFSGGGFSNYFAMPSYQTSAVSTYVKNLGSTYAGLYNASGRAYPDIAAQASGFQVVQGGSTLSVGGTSASSPTVGGIVSLLNDYRIANGKSSLGFLNPLLYSTAFTGLNDITSGSNPGCRTNGFSAAAGWDPVTGLGTPNFGKLQPIVLAA